MSENPYEATGTRLGQDVDNYDYVLASRFKRLLARIIDALIESFRSLVFNLGDFEWF